MLYVVYDDNDCIRLTSRDWRAVRAMLEYLARRDGAPRLEVYGDKEEQRRKELELVNRELKKILDQDKKE